jgi:dienelactone hydrolase
MAVKLRAVFFLDGGAMAAYSCGIQALATFGGDEMKTNTCVIALAMSLLCLTSRGGGEDVVKDPKSTATHEPLDGTKPLTMAGDIASELVAGVDRFLLRKIDESVEQRARHWKRDFSSAEAYEKSIEPNRKRLAHILGIRDPRVPFDAPELVGTTTQPALVGKGTNFEVFAVRWPAFGDVHGEGLLLVPKGKKVADVIAIPDADLTPEQITGLMPGVPAESQYARRLAESGCRVLVPVLIDRKLKKRHPPDSTSGANLTSREFLYRSAFELGRHLIAYEVQKVLAGVDWFVKDAEKGERGVSTPRCKIGVIGWGEGGMLALYAGALDTRINVVYVGGYFGDRQNIWQQPIDRNVFGLLDEFGDAELAAMVLPRDYFMIEAVSGPEVTLPGQGGAPAALTAINRETARKEYDRASKVHFGEKPGIGFHGGFGWWPGFDKKFPTEQATGDFLIHLMDKPGSLAKESSPPEYLAKSFDINVRQERQQHEIDRHNQWLLTESPYVRAKFMGKLPPDSPPKAGEKQTELTPDEKRKREFGLQGLDTTSVERYQQSIKPYRDFFAKEVIGQFDDKLLPPNPRSRKTYEGEGWTGYEVVLDVFPDVIAYGILLLPNDLKPGEKRPVVVCQHGLEGRPQDTIGKVGYPYYKAFAARLAEQGFITFAPQNLYIFQDRFRTLQRKANPLGKTLFSIMVPQHQQITDWLKSLPFVDGNRIGFYGLSYGGKSAMRIPALVDNYCLSICSADFNEWVWKNASTRSPYSYAWHGEYEIFEFDLGSTFNYAEMAALIAPRPFMVERGHSDGVAPDETVGYEFAKVRNLYEARLGLGDRCEIEWFVGPHTINGKGTFEFLHKHLNWPKR